MSEPKVNVPRRWWWVVAVAVPVAVGVLAMLPKLIEVLGGGSSSPPLSKSVVFQGSTVKAQHIVGGDYHEGAEIRTEVALTLAASAPGLAPEERRLLEAALTRLRRHDYERAIPVLRAVADKAPTPALLNNLVAAHLALGETVAARKVIEQAWELSAGADLDVQAALHWNERQLARVRTFGMKPLTASHATQWEGIEAYLTRVADTGGMVTIEAVYRNASTAQVSFCPNHHDSYIIDERANRRWDDSHYSSVNCSVRLEPGGVLSVWLKFAFAPTEHPRVTVVLNGALPFEKVDPVPDDGR